MKKEERISVFRIYLANLNTTRQKCAYWEISPNQSGETPGRCILEEDFINRTHQVLTQEEADSLCPYRDSTRAGRCSYKGNIFDTEGEMKFLESQVSQLREQNSNLTVELKIATSEIKSLKIKTKT